MSNHVMVLTAAYPTGAEQWTCAECGYQFLLQWPPHYKKIVLIPGDDTAIHSGGKGGVEMNTKVVQEDDPRLEPWEKWMEEHPE